jgi:trimethylamine--corrinoid protein Co-methyltransferase
MMGGIQVFRKWEPLTSDEIYEIHQASLEILKTVGVKVKSEKALNLLKDAGADIDIKNQTAKIPHYLVEEGVKKAPSTFTLYGRNPKFDMKMTDDRVYLGAGGTGINVLDLDGNRRPALEKDLAEVTRLIDGLPNIDFCIGHVNPSDVPQDILYPSMWVTLLTNTEKNVLHGIRGAEMTRDVFQMGCLIAGGENAFKKRPFITCCCNVVSPLQHDRLMIESAIESAILGIPTTMSPEPQSGATAPATLAGTIALFNAEVLSGITIVELAKPGSPILYGCVASIMDMKTCNYAAGAVELGLFSAAATQMAHYYDLPVYATGGMSDSKIPDAQAGYEKALQMIIVALAGANYIHDAAGMLEFSLTMSYEQLVIDNEIIGMVNRVLRGIQINEETLALDLIKKVGFNNYIKEKHTRDFFRREHYIPELSDRRSWEQWSKNGSKPINVIAREKAKKILETHHPEPIDKDIRVELQKIVEKWRKRD